MPKTRKHNVRKLAERLNEVREGPKKEPPPCECEPISNGCHCGRFQWEMTQKKIKPVSRRQIAIDPNAGDTYIVDRPPNTDIDYGEVPFRVWAKCEGQRVEVDLVEADESVEGVWWCWCDVSSITRQGGDEHWFPNDGLLKIR